MITLFWIVPLHQYSPPPFVAELPLIVLFWIVPLHQYSPPPSLPQAELPVIVSFSILAFVPLP